MAKCADDQITVRVRSARKPLRVDQVGVPAAVSPFGIAFTMEKRVRYGDTLDEEQTRMISLARQVASEAGIKLVVEDVGKGNLVLKTLKRLAGRNTLCDATIVLPCETISSNAKCSSERLLPCGLTC